MNLWKISAASILLIASCTGGALSGEGRSSTDGVETKRTFAVVMLIRGSVSGSSAGSFGLFVRDGKDSTWTKLSRSSTFSFGLSYFEHGATRRYYLAAGNGLHRSTDGGKNWRILTSWRTEEILNVTPDPVDSALIYVATPYGVFKTTDDGATWNRKMNGFRKWYIQRVIMDQADRHVLFAATEDDLYRSSNAGDHWTPLHVGASPILAVLQHPARAATLLVGIEDGGIRYTDDKGKSWKRAAGLDSASVYALRASNDGSDIYAAGWHTGLWRSQDGGKSWKQIWTDPNVEAVYSISVDPDDFGHLLVGTVGQGVYESMDWGKTWKRAGLYGAQVKQIEVYP